MERRDADHRGSFAGPLGTAHNVAVYVPERRPWVQGGPFLFHDFPVTR